MRIKNVNKHMDSFQLPPSAPLLWMTVRNMRGGEPRTKMLNK